MLSLIASDLASRFTRWATEIGLYLEDCFVHIGKPPFGSQSQIRTDFQFNTLYIDCPNQGKAKYLNEYKCQIAWWCQEFRLSSIELWWNGCNLHTIPVDTILKTPGCKAMLTLPKDFYKASLKDILRLAIDQEGICVTSHLTDGCIETSTDFNRERTGVHWEEIRKINFSFLWRELPGEKTESKKNAYYTQLKRVLERDRWVDNFEYYMYRPDGKIGHYIKNYRLTDEGLRVSSTALWEIVEREEVRPLVLV